MIIRLFSRSEAGKAAQCLLMHGFDFKSYFVNPGFEAIEINIPNEAFVYIRSDAKACNYRVDRVHG